jgi:hypothetical protein
MKSVSNFSKAGLLAGLIFYFFSLNSLFAQTTYYSRSNGNWSDLQSWSTISHMGAAATALPGSSTTDRVIISANDAIVLDIDADIASLIVGNASAAGVLTIGNDNTSRALTVNGPVTVGVNGVLQRNSALTAGSHTMRITGDQGTLTNNGQINFSDLARPVAGWATVDLYFEVGGNVELKGNAPASRSSLNSLIINKNNRTIAVGSHWTVAELLYIQAGYLDLGNAANQYTINSAVTTPADSAQIRIDINGQLRIYGTQTFPSGYSTIIAGENGTVEYTGTNQAVASAGVVKHFENLVLSGSGTKVLTDDLIVRKNLSIATGNTFNASGRNIWLEGDFANNGSFTPGAGTFTMGGIRNQTISGTASFNRLAIDKPSTSVSAVAQAVLTAAIETRLLQGRLDLGSLTGHSLGTVTGNGILALSSAAAGTTTFPAGNYTNFLTAAGNGVVEYNGNVSYNIGPAPHSYAHMHIAGNGTKSIGANTNILKDLQILPSAIFNTAAYTANIGGNLLNNGAIAGTGTLNFNNTTLDQTISGSGTSHLHNLRLSKGSGLRLLLEMDARVDNELALANEGNLYLGVNDLTIGPNASIRGASNGTGIANFSASRMIQQDGTNSARGVLVKEGTTTAQLTRLFPIGTGSIYSYVNVTQLSATITGVGSISAKAIPLPSSKNNLVKRYFRLRKNNISSIGNARMIFKYDPSEISIVGSPTLQVKRSADNVENDVNGSFVNTASSTFGVNAAGNTFLELEWRAGDPANFAKTYYSYQSGPWETPNTWTTDPTGTILQGQPAAGGPDNGDRVIVLNGRNVAITAADVKQLTSLEIQNGGTLDIQSFGGHAFGNISGAGLLRMATINVPTGNYTDFTSAVGGTIEYYNYTGALDPAITQYNNLIFSGNGVKTIGPASAANRTWTIIGNLTIDGGTLRLGAVNNSVLTIDVLGDVAINAGAAITIGNTSIHALTFHGNVTNNGSVDLVNSAQYNDAAGSGAAILTMKGATDNYFMGNGPKLDLYRLIVDKGVDQTYLLDFNPANMVLYGRVDQANGSTSGIYTQENPEILKALWVKNGTLKLGSNINIPRLSSGGNDFFIPENGAIWLNGGTVATNNSTGGSGNTGLTLYGKLRVTSGIWRGNESAGIVYRTISELIIEGGLVEVSQFRASSGGSLGASFNRSAYVQSGGHMIITGDGETNGSSAQFSLDKISSIFRMSGGILTIRKASGTGALFINAASDNFEVTGGDVRIVTENNSAFNIESTVPLYNLTLSKGSGTANVDIAGKPLTILNDLTINAGVVLRANNNDLSIGRHLTSTGTYTPGTNTTTFSGRSASQNITTANPLDFHHLTLINAQANGTLLLGGAGNVAVRGNLRIEAGTLADGGKTVDIAGDIFNAGVHSGAGKLRMINTVATQAVIDGTASGQLGNLEINDPQGVLLQNSQTMHGSLTLTQGIFNIADKNLAFTASANIVVSGPTTTKKIQTNGNKSDGGITKHFGAPGTFTYPFGVAGLYTPATVTVNSASPLGSITLNPVNDQHPFVTNSSALEYYWTASSTGFDGSKSISYNFTYDQSDVAGSEPQYIAGYYNNEANWLQGAPVNTGTNVITINNLPAIDGDYTAGRSTALGTIVAYYSRANGSWNDGNTWSTVGHGGPAAGSEPGATNPVLIGDGLTYFHTITISENAKRAGTLKLDSGSVLDLGTTVNHNFGFSIQEKVKGNGTLRLSSSSGTATFPSGDFGDFLSPSGGTVEYYGSGSNFTLPVTSQTPISIALLNYNNLVIWPNGNNITFPNENLLIHNDLTIKAGAGNARLSSNTAGRGSLDIGNDLVVDGRLQYMNGQSREIVVRNDLKIGNTGVFQVTNSSIDPQPNTLVLYGSMHNDGNFDMVNNNKYCDTYFLGDTDESLTGSGNRTDFNRLIINKGTTQDPVLEANLNNFALQASVMGSTKALELQNGTFKLTSNQNLNISSGDNGTDYSIPSTAQLWVNGGNISLTNTGTGAGLLLAGKLRIDAGTMHIEGGGTNDNYIEIAGAGRPTIEINGGELRVGSQIRRANTSTISAIRYIQTGGLAVLGTQSAPTANRALLEALNAGSAFQMSGGTLQITRQQSGTATIAALYLQPMTSSITGGTIEIGNMLTPANQNMHLYSQVPLHNLVINGHNAPKATLTVGNLRLKNNMTIQSGAEFNANNFDLFLERDFTANGTYTSGSNTTHFHGIIHDQTLAGSGAINFHNLCIENVKSSGTVALASRVIVHKTLDLAAGTLHDNGQTIEVRERVNNFARHTSSGPGKMLFNGSLKQILAGDGSGQFSNVSINNTQGLELSAVQTINGILEFVTGKLNIRATLLVLGESASIAGSTGMLNMITTNGSLSDQGVRKEFASGPFDFTFPLGVNEKYTPARYTASANSSTGQITVKPINQRHPSAAVGSDALSYYWNVSEQGFGGLTLQHRYQYAPEDVVGNDNLYVPARFTSDWTKGASLGTVAPPGIMINGGGAGVSYVEGDYTAGATSSFLPVSSFTSAQSGNWDAGSTWIGGAVPNSGAPVIISANHHVVISTNSKSTFSLEVRANARLTISSSTIGHNLGSVSGTGTLALSGNLFPGGAYDKFVGPLGGTVEYSGTNYTLPTQAIYNHLIINSSGLLRTANVDLVVRGNFELAAGQLDNSLANRRIAVFGHWINNANPTAYIGGTGVVEFTGSQSQSIGGSSSTSFSRMEVNKTLANVLLNTNTDVTERLILRKGNIETGTFQINAGAACLVERTAGHVYGRYTRNTGTSPTLYPIGDNTNYLPLTLSFDMGSTSVTAYVSAVNPATSKGKGDTGNPLQALWNITAQAFPTGARATAIFEYPDNVRQSGFQQNLAFAARWNAGLGEWDPYQFTSYPSPDEDPSRVTVSSITAFSDWAIFWDFSNNPLPIELLEFSGTAEIKDVVLRWATATETNNDYFVLERSENGRDFMEVAVINGAGNSKERKEYEYIDAVRSNSPRLYYRLKQVDFDGAYSYSKVISVSVTLHEQEQAFRCYPNPVRSTLYLAPGRPLEGTIQFVLFDQAGKLILMQSAEGMNINDVYQIGMQSFSPGVYQLKIIGENFHEVHQLVKP